MDLVSRITVILICPGNSMEPSTFFLISRESAMASRSVTRSGWTMTRTSRPAWMAYAFSTPLKESQIAYSAWSRLT